MLFKVFYDILNDVDSRDVSILSLLDLSVAFDTIDHNIVLSRVETSYGIRGTAFI